jgi:hypothetical protein
MKTSGFLYAALLSLGFFACGVDDLPPNIQFPNDAIYTSKFMGDSIHVMIDFTDNEALNQYKIDIHSNHDGHNHGKPQDALEKWDTLIIGSLSGTADALDFYIPVPMGYLPGPYHFTVFCLDKNGNETTNNFQLIFKDATDTIPPTVVLQTPSSNASLSTPFVVSANISDQLSNGNSASELNRVELILENISSEEEFKVADYNAVQLGSSLSLYDPATGVLNLSNLSIPSAAAAGNYRLRLLVFDAYFNLGVAEVPVVLP